MKGDVMNKLLADLNGSITEIRPGEPSFHDRRYEPKPLNEKNFYKLEPIKDIKRKISFIDGGNLKLYSSPTFSIHLVRIYFNLFEGKERIDPENIPQQIDFYALGKVFMEEDEVHYEGKVYPTKGSHEEYLPDGEDLVFNSWDESIRSGKFRGDINKVCDSARRFAEWKIAGELAKKELDENDIIVRDGSLQTSVSNESKYANEAYKEAKKSGVIFTGLAKTSKLYTTTGNSLSKVIRDLGEEAYPEEKWFYYPVADVKHPDHKAEIFFVKLHKESDYIFRYEINRDQSEEMDLSEIKTILEVLAENSKDISFPGYPYGLIDADKFARVSKREAEQHRTKLKAYASKGESWEEIEKFLSATNAHEKLDRLK